MGHVVNLKCISRKILLGTGLFALLFVAVTWMSAMLGAPQPLSLANSHSRKAGVFPYHDSVDNTTPAKNSLDEPYTKRTHIGFLKVHKAGSTTMQNIFFRFGLKNKLNIAIPKRGNFLSRKSTTIVPKEFKHYDILACHTVYNKKIYDDFLPVNSVKIGIVREPFDRMVSAAYYYRDVFGVSYLKNIPKENFILNLVRYPEKYDRSFSSHTKNTMADDFGFPHVNKNDVNKINGYLRELNKDFQLVLITEKFDESLVLMRRFLNWPMADIIYLASNTHNHTPTVISENDLNKFKSTSFLDYAIYDYFLEIFNRKLKEAGPDLVDEVHYFKELLAKVKVFCDADLVEGKNLDVEGSKWNKKINVTRIDCNWMKTGEMTFINKLKNMYISGSSTAVP